MFDQNEICQRDDPQGRTPDRPLLRVQRAWGDVWLLGPAPYRAPARLTVRPGAAQGPDGVNAFHFMNQYRSELRARRDRSSGPLWW
jgi:hypothetical protein